MKRGFSLLLILLLIVGCVSFVHSAENVIQVGHVINITVLEHAELSRSVLVREDGTTDYPLLSNIPLDGMTVSELSRYLRPLLTKFVEGQQFFINISEYRMLNVKVLGQVVKPGPLFVKGPIGLQGIIAEAGGPREAADLKKVTIIRRGPDKKVDRIVVDMYDFFASSSDETLPEIFNNDMIIVPMLNNQSFVRVIGEVRSPGKFIPELDENIADLVYRAGGKQREGNMNDVKHIYKNNGRYELRKVKLKKLIHSGRTDEIPLVSPGDIIVVGELPFYKDVHFMSQFMRDIALLISSYVILRRL